MKDEIKRYNAGGRIADILSACALMAVLVCAVLLCCTSMKTTSRIDPLRYHAQHIQTMDDGWRFNLLVTLGACVALRLFFFIPFSRRFARRTAAVLLPLLAAFGIYWVIGAKAIPISDAGILYRYGIALINGNTASLADMTSYDYFYFARFPFQFGFFSYMELMLRLFGERGALVAVPVLNVLYLVSAYYALVRATDTLFADGRVTLLTTLFLCACLQPVFACTWMYGLIPAFAGAVWAVYFIVLYMRSGKRRWLFTAAVFCALAVYMKPNAWIPVVAICIALLLSAIRARSWKRALAALLLAALCVPLPKAAQAVYEARIGVSYGTGYPMSSWMAMGMRESSMASGWYNSYSQDLYGQYGADADAWRERAEADIAASLAAFAADPDYARFFYTEKLSSQWNEPTFMSLWLSMACEPYGARSALASQLYDFDGLGGTFAKLENYALQLMYAGFVLSALTLLFRRRDEMLIFPLIVLGGVLYHILFEASAKYTLSYIALLCPLAAYGILNVGQGCAACLLKREKPSGEEALSE